MNKRRFNYPRGPRNLGRNFGRGFKRFPQRTMANSELIAVIQTVKAVNEIKHSQPEAEYIPTNKFEGFKKIINF